jgi:hypothetical protein
MYFLSISLFLIPIKERLIWNERTKEQTKNYEFFLEFLRLYCWMKEAIGFHEEAKS